MNLTSNNKCSNEQDKLIINQHANTTSASINWNILLHKELTYESDYQVKYRLNWLLLEKYIQQQKNEVIQLLLTRNYQGFNWRADVYLFTI